MPAPQGPDQPPKSPHQHPPAPPTGRHYEVHTTDAIERAACLAVPREGARERQLAHEPNPFKRALKIVGPGVITGASDDDPSGIGTYAVAGAAFGYSMLWIALVSYPLMAGVQYICAKVGLCTGQGLAGVLKAHYPRKLLYPVLFALLVANTINAGADIGAIAAAIGMFVPLPVAWMIVPIGLGILLAQMYCSYRRIARVFKWLCLALLAYIGSAFFAHPHWPDVLHGTFVPTLSLNGSFLATVVAILGTTISPYLFFWQASQEVEEQKAVGLKQLWQRRGASDAELSYAAWDVNLGMFLSNVVMYFIIFSTAATLFTAGQHQIHSATDAAAALRPLAGDLATTLFALGIIGAGLLAIPILTGASAFALAEAFGWRHSLDRKPHEAKAFYGVIAASTLAGIGMNFIGINPIDALFWTAVINGVLAPPLLFVIMHVTNNPAIMGRRVNGRLENGLGYAAAVIMSLAAIGLFVTWGK